MNDATHLRAAGHQQDARKLSDIYEPRDARRWLFARQGLRDNQMPAELIQQGRVDEVLAALNPVLDGAYIAEAGSTQRPQGPAEPPCPLPPSKREARILAYAQEGRAGNSSRG